MLGDLSGWTNNGETTFCAEVVRNILPVGQQIEARLIGGSQGVRDFVPARRHIGRDTILHMGKGSFSRRGKLNHFVVTSSGGFKYRNFNIKGDAHKN